MVDVASFVVSIALTMGLVNFFALLRSAINFIQALKQWNWFINYDVCCVFSNIFPN